MRHAVPEVLWNGVSWFHANPGQFAEDRRRDAELSSRGFVVLRFTWHDIVHHREWWLARVRDSHRALRGRW